MQHPCLLHESVTAIASYARFDLKRRWMRQSAFAMQLPEKISPDGFLIDEKGMTLSSALRPIADIVHVENAQRATHANDRPEVDQGILQPPWTFETTMHKQAVQADRMPQAKRKDREAAGKESRWQAEC